MRKFAHIVSPVIASEPSDLTFAQPITFETMRLAKQFATDSGDIEVALYSAHFAEDAGFVPEWFTKTPVLDRSTLDLGNFEVRRKLPILSDILRRLHDAAEDADYLVYTNVDIGLLPYFYVAINELIEKGHDAFTISRRSISAHYRHLAEIPLMWSDLGTPHPGWDCFVFRREILPRLDLGDVCLGAVNVGRAFVINLIVAAENFADFTDLHLTFHVGNDRVWTHPSLQDYARFNLEVVLRLLHSLKQRGDLPDHPVLRSMIDKIKEVGSLPDDF